MFVIGKLFQYILTNTLA